MMALLRARAFLVRHLRSPQTSNARRLDQALRGTRGGQRARRPSINPINVQELDFGLTLRLCRKVGMYVSYVI